jgi:hypothetical protein
MWHQWVNGVLGLWIIISPFLGFSPDGMTTNLVIVGIVVALLGFLGAVQTSGYRNRDREWERTHQHA